MQQQQQQQPLQQAPSPYQTPNDLTTKMKQVENNAERIKRFPIFSNETIDNPYRIGDHIEFLDRDPNMDTQWITASVVDKENNWIIIRFVNNSDDENDIHFRNDRKIHVLKHKERLRFLTEHHDAYHHDHGNHHQDPHAHYRENYSSDSADDEYKQQRLPYHHDHHQPQQHGTTPQQHERYDEAKKRKKNKRLLQKQEKQERQYELNVFVNEIARFNWNLIFVPGNNDGKNSLYRCFCLEIYGDNNSKSGYKQIKKEVEQYKSDNAEYFRHFGLNTMDSNMDYMTLIALSELYNVRIKVFEIDFSGKSQPQHHHHHHHPEPQLILSFDCGDYQQTMHLPIVYLAFVHNTHFHVIEDVSSFNVHQRPLIHYIKHTQSNNLSGRISVIREFRFRKFYQKLFDHFDEDGDGQLDGQQIYDFFLSSTLQTDVLRTIWDESVGDNCRTMNVEQFICAMDLILGQQLQMDNNRQIEAIHSHKPGAKHKIRKKSTQIRSSNNANNNHHNPAQRNSANDAVPFNIIHAGLPNMKYPVNPYDTYNIYKPLKKKQASHDYSDQNDEIKDSMYYQNTSTSNANQVTMRRSTDMSHPTTTPQTTTKTTTTEKRRNGGTGGGGTKYQNNTQQQPQYGGPLNKQNEFIRFYNSMNFGSKQEFYYEKIAEFEYNDIEKMMELDRDILIEEFEMSADHVSLFLNKLNKFIKKHQVFKRWLVSKLKMRRYFVKFVNEGILTFDIFLDRFETYHDILPLIGDKNVNDAKLLFRKLPKK